MSFNFATILREGAPTIPKTVLFHAGAPYREVDGASGRVAAGLRALGWKPDQKELL